MRGLLFGLQIPDSAVRVEVRPFVGAGKRRTLFSGDLEDCGRLLTDDEVADSVSTDKAFWEYVKGARDEGKLKEAVTKKHLNCRVSLQFLDQSGTAIVVGEKGETWAHSTASFDFYRSKKSKKKDNKEKKLDRFAQRIEAAMTGAANLGVTVARESSRVAIEQMRLTDKLLDMQKAAHDLAEERVGKGIAQNAYYANKYRETSEQQPQTPGLLDDLIKTAAGALIPKLLN